MWDGVKVGIDSGVHGVQAIWDTKSTTNNWVFLLLNAKNACNEINRIRMMWTV